jgi:hypothetical protein
MTTLGKRLMPHHASLADNPGDRGSSVFPPMGPSVGVIVGQLVARSGHPEVGHLVPRPPVDGLCETCLGSPDQPSLYNHVYQPVTNRVPGTHPSVDDGRVHNFSLAADGPGEQLLDTSGDLRLSSGAAEAEWNKVTARHRPGPWPRPDPREISL